MWQGVPWSLLGGSSHLLSRLYPLTLLLPLISSLTTKYLVQDAVTPSWAEENAPKDRVVLGTGSMEQFVFQIVFHHLVKHIFGLYASTLFPFTLGTLFIVARLLWSLETFYADCSADFCGLDVMSGPGTEASPNHYRPRPPCFCLKSST